MSNNKNKKKSGLGVIVGRFQTPHLHEGHQALLRQSLENNYLTLIVVGSPATPMTKNNPLDYEIRWEIINRWLLNQNEYYYHHSSIVNLDDCSSNEVWSQNLDSLILEEVTEYGENEVTLYHGRDSFAESYCGKYTDCMVEVDSISDISASEIRKKIGEDNLYYDIISSLRDSEDIDVVASSIIWTAENMFPRVQPTVDVAPLLINESGGYNILLGKKPGANKYCFVGGFVDMTDETGEAAACRELKEETNIGCKPEQLRYVSQHKINDWRDSSSTSVMTTLFLTVLNESQCVDIKPQDDIANLKWFVLNDLDENMISNQHKSLFRKLKEIL